MTTLEQAISETLDDWKNLAPSTYESRVNYYEKLKQMARERVLILLEKNFALLS
ncbi:MAG: hypothetical protein PF495_01045 [Spirochaetales bacterium]|jgi:hypothetical protein|nr:hypothetical protein [Spirochaetales bacterium]